MGNVEASRLESVEEYVRRVSSARLAFIVAECLQPPTAWAPSAQANAGRTARRSRGRLRWRRNHAESHETASRGPRFCEAMSECTCVNNDLVARYGYGQR